MNNRFYKFTLPDLKTGCINWIGSKDRDGYGYFKEGKTYKAHRYAYQHLIGDIGTLHVLHKCDNPSCVNPDHLFLSTNADNMRDKVSKNRQSHYSRCMQGELNPNRQLSYQGVCEIYQARGKILGKDLAKQYGVTPTQISRIQLNKSWIE